MAGEVTEFEIDPERLQVLRGNGEAVAVLDVREPWEVAICALDGSLRIPMRQVPSRIGELPTDRMLVVLCHHGMRSAQVTAWLRARGFERAINLTGGIAAWAQRVDPSMRRY